MQIAVDMTNSKVELRNKGIVLDIRDNDGKHLGHLRIGQATLEWRPGRTREGNGKTIKWPELIALLDEL